MGTQAGIGAVCVGVALAGLLPGCSRDSSLGLRDEAGRRSSIMPRTTEAGPPDPGVADESQPITGAAGAASDEVPATNASCTDDCPVLQAGAGGVPFDVQGNAARGVDVGLDGALVLSSAAPSAGSGLIWIANTATGTVSKVDTATVTELARYAVPGDDLVDDEGPTALSVDRAGNVYVAVGDLVSMFSAAGPGCADRNGDGIVTTSRGPDDVLLPGLDECLMWTADVGDDATALLIQDSDVGFELTTSAEGSSAIERVPAQRTLWVGTASSDALQLLDPLTGRLLDTAHAPVPVHALATDGRGNLWISGAAAATDDDDDAGIAAAALGRVDTRRCLEGACAVAPVCTTRCSTSVCETACDDAVLERIELGPATLPGGLTVDCHQRVWLADPSDSGGVLRYDALASEARLTSATMAFPAQGIAVDAAGSVWSSAAATGVFRVDADSLEVAKVVGTGGMDFSWRGVAIDDAGLVWAVHPQETLAMVIDPGASLGQASIRNRISTLGGAALATDMTGMQGQLAAREPGTYRQRFTGCEDGLTAWGELDWDAELPEGASVIMLGRSAGTPEALEAAQWLPLAGLPGTGTPLDLAGAGEGAGLTGAHLELEMRLSTDPRGRRLGGGCMVEEASSPRIRRLSLSFRCAPSD